MQTQQGFADVNGTHLYYEMAGSGHPLILIHEFALDTRMWDNQFEVFAQQNQVLRYDGHGYGKSEFPTTEAYDHSDDLRALMGHLGIDQAHLIGLSMGGRNAINFGLTYPEATDTLIAVDTGLDGYHGVGEPPLRSIWRIAQQDGIEAAKTAWLHHPFFDAAREQAVVTTQLTQMVSTYSGWHWVNRDPGIVPAPVAIQRLDTIQAPTLIIMGERALPDLHGIASILAQGIPGAERVLMPGVGHLVNMEDPERFNEIVLGFLAEVTW